MQSVFDSSFLNHFDEVGTPAHGLPSAAYTRADFFQLEGIFLTAIQLHKIHVYDHFGGLIGSERAGQIAASADGDGLIDFSPLRTQRISNGWEINYKNPMQQFMLIEPDLALAGGLRLTDRGKSLAKAYSITKRAG